MHTYTCAVDWNNEYLYDNGQIQMLLRWNGGNCIAVAIWACYSKSRAVPLVLFVPLEEVHRFIVASASSLYEDRLFFEGRSLS